MSMRARNIRNPTEATKAIMRGEPAPSCAVMGESEVQSIYDLVDRKATRVAEAEAARREALRQASEKRVANWPNTIEAQRSRKEQARQDRHAEEEERRRKIDEEEAAYQNAQKQRILDNANRHQYEQNDKVKAFTSKLFMATVLTEREKQIEANKAKQERAAEEEREWHRVEKEMLAKAHAAEAEKLKQMRLASEHLRQSQVGQLDEIRTRKIGERDANIAEGLHIKAKAQEALAEEKAAEARRRSLQAATNREYAQTNKDNLVWREERLAAEAREEAKIQEFAVLKEQQMNERRARADERFNAKLKRRQDIIDAQAERLAEINAAVEEREMRAMRDYERERTERERREQDGRKRRQEEIEDFRAQQRQRGEDAKVKAQMEAARMKEVWKQRGEMLIDEELEERRTDRERAARLQKFHLLQMQEKQQQSLHERRKEIEEGISLQDALKSEEDMYTNYVNAVMGDYVRNGKEASVIQKATTMRRV